MRLKTYVASSVESAMLLALEQLGPEAMIVNSRKLPPKNKHFVFAEAPDAGLTRPDSEAIERPTPDAPRAATGTPDRDAGRIQFYGRLHQEWLMFTRLDETIQVGTMVFVGSGGRIPEHLKPANTAQPVLRIFVPEAIADGLTWKAAA